MNENLIEKNLKSELTKNMPIKDHVKIVMSDIYHILDVRDQLIRKLTFIPKTKTIKELIEVISSKEKNLMLISDQDQLLVNYLDENCSKYKAYDIYYEIIKYLNSKSILSIEKKANDNFKEVEKNILMVFKDFFKPMKKWEISYRDSIYKPMPLDYVMNRMLRYKELANKGYFTIFENDYFKSYRNNRHNIFLPTIKLTYKSYSLYIHVRSCLDIIISDCGSDLFDDPKSKVILDTDNIFTIIKDELEIKHKKNMEKQMIKEQIQKLIEQNKKTKWGRIKNFIFY